MDKISTTISGQIDMEERGLSMESADRVRNATKVILQLSPSILAACFVVVLLVGLLFQSIETHNEKPNARKLPAKQVIASSLLIILSYIAQSALVVTEIFTSKGPLASTDRNVYSLAQVLVWTVTLASFVNIAEPRLLSFGGFWVGVLSIEITLLALTLEDCAPRIPLEWAQYALQVSRIVILLFLLSVVAQCLARGAHEKGNDEEAAPLLGGSQAASGEPQNGHVLGYGSPGMNGEAQKPKPSRDQPGEGEEEEEDEDDKKEREDLEKMKNHIKEKGGFFAYAKEFWVFAPLIWPTNNPELHIYMIAIGVILVAIRIANVLVPRQLGILINSLSDSGKGNAFRELGIYIVYAFIDSSAGLYTLRQFLWTPVELNARQTIKAKSFNHIMSLSGDFHDNKRSGELHTAMHQGTSVVDLLETILFELSPMIVDLVVACAYFYYIFDAYMLLIVTTTMISYFWVTSYLAFKQTAVRRKFFSAIRRRYQVQYDTMDGWKTVSYFNRLLHAQQRFGKSVASEMQSEKSYYFLGYFTTAVQSCALDVGLYSACFYAVYQIIYKGASVGSFIVLTTYWAQLSGPLGYLARIYRNTIGELIDAEQLLALLQTKITVTDGDGIMQYKEGQVDFEKVDFYYDKEKQIITDLSFHVNPGQTVALVGKTGSGKSTILKLLFRFYDVKGGSIKIDNQDLRHVSVQSLRELIGVVPQDSTMFNDTIMTNVRYAKLDATDDEVMDACKAAAIHDDIVDFVKGYHSQVGERGVKLSGGQLQRIAIARAILKNPKIILLDEATSAVDTETEGKIQAALEKLAKDRTTFVVAHRLSTVNNADLILVVEKGRILEHGSPAELMKSKGKFYSLWMKQMGLRNGPGEGDEEESGAGIGGDEGKLVADLDPELSPENGESKGNKEHAVPKAAESD